jgi:multiple sugar transport system substrate-binding protein
MGAEGENVAQMLPGFRARYPEIEVRLQILPWTAAHEKLLTAFAGDATPDLCQLGNTWIPEMQVLGAIDDLGPWLARSAVIVQGGYFPGIWETNVIDGKVCGIPWYVDTRLLYYRKDIFAAAGYNRPPATWKEWKDLSRTIVKMRPGSFAMLMPTNEWAPQIILGLQSGSGLLKDENTRGDFSGEPFTRAFEFYSSFFEEHLAPVGITQVTNIYQGISEGYFAGYITGPWNIGEFRRRIPPALQGLWMTAPMPGPDSSSPGVSLAGGSSLVIFRASRQKEAAWRLMEYLSEPARQLEFYALTGDLPARRESWLDTTMTGNVYVRAFFQQLLHVRPTPKIPEWEQIAMKAQEYAEVVSNRRMSVRETLAALDREVDVILEKRRWLVYGR